MRRIDSGCIVNDNISVGGAGGGTAAPPLFGHLKKLKHNGKWHNRWFVAEQHFLSYTGSDREELRFVVDLNAPDATVRIDILSNSVFTLLEFSLAKYVHTLI